MADAPQVVRGIDWREAFPFTHIFRAFRIAIHPSKLMLALAAVLCLYFGGRLLDALWPAQHRAAPNEILLFEQSPDAEAFRRQRTSIREQAFDDYARLLRQVAAVKGADWNNLISKPENALVAAKQADHVGDVRFWIASEYRQAVQDARADYDRSTKDAAALDQLRRNLAAAGAEYRARMGVVQTVAGQGLFDVFFAYQRLQIRKVIEGVLGGNWLGGWVGENAEDGVYKSAFKFFFGAAWWAIRHHWVYFLLYGALLLVVWSLFGGAIARIAAVHVADEGRKLSMRQGLSFAVSKFLSFLSAPLIPLIIVAGIGLVLALISALLFLIRLEVVLAAFYFLALAAGFVMTLVVLGTIGGLNLMYPTIAVEGSDSFDAISRSFSYVYAKPWRMLLYTTVALAYGAICYLFVRLFVWLVLVITHVCVGLLVFREASDLRPLWTALQPMPVGSFRFPSDVPFEVLGWYGDLTAGLLSVWVYLTVAMLAAFAISLYFSASTVIYYLVRRDTDATELDDVYLEQPEEDFAGVAGEPAPTAAPETPPATEAAPGEPRESSSSAQDTPRA